MTTVDELLAELESVLRSDDAPEGYYTVTEISARMGVGRVAVQRRLQALAQTGRLDFVRVTRSSIDGRAMSVPAYRIRD